MLGCWKENPDERLSFMELRSLFDAMMVREESYININIEELLLYYPTTAFCDTTDSSDDNNCGFLSPKDYEIPITHTNRFQMSQGDPTTLSEVMIDGKNVDAIIDRSFEHIALSDGDDGSVQENGGL